MWLTPYLFKVSNRNTRKRCKMRSKLTIKTPERSHRRRSDVFNILNTWLWTYFTHFSNVSFTDFKHINDSWVNLHVVIICTVHIKPKEELQDQKPIRDSFQKFICLMLKHTISLQIFYRLSSTNFTWSILEYFVPNIKWYIL